MSRWYVTRRAAVLVCSIRKKKSVRVIICDHVATECTPLPSFSGEAEMLNYRKASKYKKALYTFVFIEYMASHSYSLFSLSLRVD